MRTGMEWDDPEVYNELFARTTRLYLGRDVQGYVRSRPIVAEPGTRFHDNSAHTVLAARVLEKATGRELSFCCLAASVWDFARLGQFVLRWRRPGETRRHSAASKLRP